MGADTKDDGTAMANMEIVPVNQPRQDREENELAAVPPPTAGGYGDQVPG